MSLMKAIAMYDEQQMSYIRTLEHENERLKAENDKLQSDLLSYISTVDRMKLELILGGALTKPKQEAAEGGSV